MRAEDRIRDVLARLADTTASVYIVPDFFVFELLHARWTNVNGLPAVSVFENPLYGVDGLLKRTADLVLGSLLLAAAAIPMLIISILVKLTSPGPVFFRQKRYGLDGREILVWKFRTMTCCDNGSAVQQATQGDDRITPIGRILRRTSLDELPQLFNVIEGSMSLVGPRPHANAHNEQYRSQIDGYMLRHKVKPGITGLAQVNGYRGETETLEKMDAARRLRPPVHPRMVVLAGLQDPAQDAAGGAGPEECVLEQGARSRSEERGARRVKAMPPSNQLFRFEDLEVWQRAADAAVSLGTIADQLEQGRRFRFAEQLRSASLSISNNIAEGSGSSSKKEFRQFLNFARRSAFECANMLLIFERQEALSANVVRLH